MNPPSGGEVRSAIDDGGARAQHNVWSLLPIAISVFLLAALTAFRMRGGVEADSGVLAAPVVAFYELFGFEPAFMCSLLVLAWSSIWFLTGEVHRPWPRVGRIFAVTVCLAILVNLRVDGVPSAHGGWLGGFFAVRLYSVFGFVLSTLVVSAATILLLFRATDNFFIRYFEGLGRKRPSDVEDSVGVEAQAVDELQSLRFATPEPAEPKDPERVERGGVRLLGPAPRLRRRGARARASEPEVDDVPVEAESDIEAELDAIERQLAQDAAQAADEEDFVAAEAPVTEASLKVEGATADADDVDEEGFERDAELGAEDGDDEFEDEDSEEEDFDEAENDDEVDDYEDEESFEEDDEEEYEEEYEEEFDDEADDEEEDAEDESEYEDAGADSDEEDYEESGDEEDFEGDEEEEEFDDEDVIEHEEEEEEEVEVEDEEVEVEEAEADEEEVDEVEPTIAQQASNESEFDPTSPTVVVIPEENEPVAAEHAEPVEADEDEESEADEPEFETEPEPVVELPAVPPAASNQSSRQGALFGAAAADDELIDEAALLVLEYRRASANFLRRRLRVSAEDAMEVLAELARRGVIDCEPGAANGRVLMDLETWQGRDG